MPNKEQNMKATKNNMAAQQKEKKKKYTSVENSDGTTTNTFEKKRKLGKNKGEVKKRVTSKVKKNKSGETRGLASVTQKYDKKGELKTEKGSGKYSELASLRESVKKNDGIAASQQRGKVNLMKQKAKAKASKNKSAAAKNKGTITKPAKTTSSISKVSLKLNPNKEVFKNIEVKNNHNFKFEKEGPMPNMAAPMKGDYAAKMSDTDMGIKERYGKQATSDVLAAQQKGNPIMPKALKKDKDQYHTSGLPKFITSVESDERFNTTTGGIDEGSFSKITTKIPERSKVTATESGENYEKGEKFYVDPAKMQAKHPSMQRMSNMVTKVATYNMPNVKAAQKKYHK